MNLTTSPRLTSIVLWVVEVAACNTGGGGTGSSTGKAKQEVRKINNMKKDIFFIKPLKIVLYEHTKSV
jgi:hypothetical protein